MCACEPGFVCQRCEPRRAVDLGDRDYREEELERRERELSNPDFLKPYGEAQ